MLSAHIKESVKPQTLLIESIEERIGGKLKPKVVKIGIIKMRKTKGGIPRARKTLNELGASKGQRSTAQHARVYHGIPFASRGERGAAQTMG